MEKLKVAGGIVALTIAVSIGTVYFYPPNIEVTNNVREIPKEQLGAIPGDEVSGNYFTVGGVEFASVSRRMVNASSTCAFKNPFNATSTITSFNAGFRNVDTAAIAVQFSISTSTEADLWNATTPATSTPALVFEHQVGTAPALNNISWFPNLRASTSVGTAQTGKLFIASDYLEGSSPFFLRNGEYVGLAAATSSRGAPTTQMYSGTCSATFQRM